MIEMLPQHEHLQHCRRQISSNRRYNYYKLIVAYDGTRFHGFQRQIDNETMMERIRNQKMLASIRPKKRPHYYDVLNEGNCSGGCGCGGGSSSDVCNDDHSTSGTAKGITVTNTKMNMDRSIEIAAIRKGCNISVQEVIEILLFDLFPSITSIQDIGLKFAGRTDKGVHANGQVCIIKLPNEDDEDGNSDQESQAMSSYSNNKNANIYHDEESDRMNHFDYKCWKLRNDMNSRLPIDISIQHISVLPLLVSQQQVTTTFNAVQFDPRRDVQLKKYTYTIRYRRRNNDSQPQQQLLQSMIDQYGGPHSIRTASDSYCLWIVPWSLDDTDIPLLCQLFSGPIRKNFYHFIHKADRDNPNKSTTQTINEMSYEIINTTTEYISNSSIQINTNVDDPTNCINSTHTMSNHPSITMVTSDIVTGRFTFIAKSFRRTMIRNIVGFCIDACRQLPDTPSQESISILLNDTSCDSTTNTGISNDESNNHERSIIINAAPASGLCLEWVKY
jgi:tRNA pseudouridine(38-40) synthase